MNEIQYRNSYPHKRIFNLEKIKILNFYKKFILFFSLLYTIQGFAETNKACEATQRQDWAKARIDWIAKSPGKDKIDILFLGDSITRLWEYSATHRYPGGLKTWEKLFVPLNAKDFGIIGDRTENLLWCIRKGKMLDNTNPKLVVLLIGTNNLHRKGGGDSVEDIAEGIKLIVEEIKNKLPKSKILLLGILPRGWTPAHRYRAKIKQINILISKLADDKKVFFIDQGQCFVDKDGNTTKDILRDGLHLSPKAYEIWGKALLPEILRILKSKPQGKDSKLDT